MLIGTKADFSQNDPQWSGELIGFTTSETMGKYGCLITAFANVAQAQGSDFDPNTMNAALKDHGLFVRDSLGQIGDVAGYHALAVVAPHSKFVEQKNWDVSELAPAEYFDVRASVDVEVIVEIDYHPEESGLQSHYCRVIGLDDARNDVEVVDSFTGKRIWLSSISERVGKQALQIIWGAGKYDKI